MRWREGLVALLLWACLITPSEAAGFPWGQCTYWAAQMRPDIGGWTWGDASDWGREARLAGFSVGGAPRVGAIVVFPPWTYEADGLGHVAYVTRVSGRWFQVSEMNWWPWGPGRVDYRWVYDGGGIAFIY